MPQSTPSLLAVELRNLAKSFGACVANADISLNVKSGTIHGIVGENGAGKSTAMNMLYGLYAPDSGEILVNGQEMRFRFPTDALAAGLGMVHQHFSLSGPETVLDNILLGDEPVKKSFCFLPPFLRPIHRRAAEAKIQEIAERYGLALPWRAPVETLSVGQQQRVEILKLLYRDAKILILDEPTAVLTPQETEQIFSNLRALRDQGKTILIITHKLKELLDLTSEVTVFRAGRVVGHRITKESSESDLAELMVGRKIELSSRPYVAQNTVSSEVLLEFKDVSLKKGDKHLLSRLNFSIRSGEILGIAGVHGNGQSELQRLLLNPKTFFASRQASGSILFRGKDIKTLSTSELFHLGLAFVPEDRLKEGVIPSENLSTNFMLGLHQFSKYCRHGILDWAALDQDAQTAITNFRVKAGALSSSAGGLSGGNQQKLILARELSKAPNLLFAAQPTRGVDIGAIEFIHDELRKLQASGHAVLLVSCELSEILSLSNRILVFFNGRIATEMSSELATESKLGLAMGGA